MINNQLLNIDFLKKECEHIHFFGLGFIQLKLNEHQRLHFYSSKLPSLMNEEEIHNHRYDFQSYILKGTLKSEHYKVVEGNDYILEQESCKPGIDIKVEPKLCSIKHINSHIYNEGSKYKIEHDVFHKVFGIDCITYLMRGLYMKDNADVIRKVNSEKICPFSKQIPEPELWDIVESMIS